MGLGLGLANQMPTTPLAVSIFFWTTCLGLGLELGVRVRG